MLFFRNRIAKSHKNQIPTDGVFHAGLNVLIRLGQTQKQVEKQIPLSTSTENGCLYQDGLLITYADGKVASLSLLSPYDVWRTTQNLGVSSPSNAVEAALGKAHYVGGDDHYYYFGPAGENVGCGSGNVKYFVDAVISDGRVVNFYILDFKVALAGRNARLGSNRAMG